MTDVKVVAPMNMGERLDWDAQTKKYNVNVDDLEKRLHALENKKLNDVIPEQIDLGAGTVHGTSYTIDYGAFIEVNLRLEMPLVVPESPPQKTGGQTLGNKVENYSRLSLSERIMAVRLYTIKKLLSQLLLRN